MKIMFLIWCFFLIISNTHHNWYKHPRSCIVIFAFSFLRNQLWASSILMHQLADPLSLKSISGWNIHFLPLYPIRGRRGAGAYPSIIRRRRGTLYVTYTVCLNYFNIAICHSEADWKTWKIAEQQQSKTVLFTVLRISILTVIAYRRFSTSHTGLVWLMEQRVGESPVVHACKDRNKIWKQLLVALKSKRITCETKCETIWFMFLSNSEFLFEVFFSDFKKTDFLSFLILLTFDLKLRSLILKWV